MPGNPLSKSVLAYGLRIAAGVILAFAGYNVAPSLDVIVLSPIRPVVSSIKWLLPLLLVLFVVLRKPGLAYALVGVMTALSMLLGAGGDVATLVIGSIVASSVVYTLSLRFEVETGSVVKRRTSCNLQCILLSIAGTGMGYLLLALAIMYATMIAARIYGSLLSPPEGIPEIARVAWSILGESPIVRILVVMLVVMVFYYVVNRLVSPLLYAITASPGELRRDIRKMIMIEVSQVVAGKKWYHRMLNLSMILLGYVVDTLIIFVFIALFFEMANTFLGRDINPMILWGVAGLASMAISYKLTKSMFRMLSLSSQVNWRGIILGSSLGLAGLIILYTFYIYAVTGVSLSEGLQYSLRAFFNVLQGYTIPEPSSISLRIEGLEQRMALAYKQIDSLLGLIVELFWG